MTECLLTRDHFCRLFPYQRTEIQWQEQVCNAEEKKVFFNYVYVTDNMITIFQAT